MSDKKVLQILKQLECKGFNPGTQPYPLLLDERRVCHGIKDQRENLKCVCDKIEDLLMGQARDVIDDYPLDDVI